MLKKSILLVISLLAIGLTVVSAQSVDSATMRELEQLANDFQAGRITLPEFQRRTAEINQRVMGANQPDIERGIQELQQLQQQPYQPPQQQAQPQQQTQQQGQNAGWPPASAFQSYFRISPLTQPAGTTARYDGGDRGMEIFLTGGNSNTVLQNLKQQVERIIGRQMPENRYDGGYIDSIQDPNQRSNDNRIQFWLRTENNVVILSIRAVAG